MMRTRGGCYLAKAQGWALIVHLARTVGSPSLFYCRAGHHFQRVFFFWVPRRGLLIRKHVADSTIARVSARHRMLNVEDEGRWNQRKAEDNRCQQPTHLRDWHIDIIYQYCSSNSTCVGRRRNLPVRILLACTDAAPGSENWDHNPEYQCRTSHRKRVGS